MHSTDETRNAFRFFLRHASFRTPPGRAACALALARAERDGKSVGLRFAWVDDPEGRADLGPGGRCPCGCARHVERVESCLVFGPDDDTRPLGSIGDVWDASADYRRVV